MFSSDERSEENMHCYKYIDDRITFCKALVKYNLNYKITLLVDRRKGLVENKYTNTPNL